MRGMTDVDKMDSLKDLIRKIKPTRVLIQETHMMKINNRWITNLWGNNNCQWKDTPSQGLSGGLLTIWDDTLLEKKNELIGPNTLSHIFKSKTEDFEWTVTNVYSPCSYWEREEFWEEMDDTAGWAIGKLGHCR